ncbi:MAG: hypothetical protein QGI75_07145 [Phycisphaerales bacterium]|jgi:hypothetical protein|nr:hypothetical protein [Phycisphaerales bacterium]MDP6890598.1 hypothetical protein [Phycisphaerales bacterium]
MHERHAGDTVVIVTAVLTIGLCASDAGDLRATFEEARTTAETIDAGLTLLDDLLVRQWSEDLTLELAMIGLPDADRDEQARTLIDEALVITDAVDEAILAAAADGIRVRADSVRWRRARGLACAAAAVLEYEQIEWWREAMTHLRQAAAARGDTSGRLRRMLAQVHLSRGEFKQATTIALEIAEGTSVTPLQRTMAEAILLRCHHTPEPQTALDHAEEAWQVVLLGEAILQASTDTMTALRWIAPIRAALGRCGVPIGSHGRLAANMAARLAPTNMMAEEELASLDPAAIIGAARSTIEPSDAVQWLDALAERPPARSDEEFIFEAQAQCHGRFGDVFGAMHAWRNAASVGSADSPRYWDEAARAAVAAFNAGHDSSGEIRDVLKSAAGNGSMRAAWMRSLASIDARVGDVAMALDRLTEVPPAGPEHLRALEQIGQLLGDRRRTLGRWTDGDRDRLELARRAAVAAASQRTDPRRAAMAAPIAGMLAAMLIELQLNKGDVEAAEAARRDDEAIGWLAPIERAFLDMQLAALAGDCDVVAAMMGQWDEQHDVLVRRLMLWAGGPSVADAAQPDHPTALGCLLGAISIPRPTGSTSELLRMAESLCRGGRCDWAVAWFNAALAEDSTLLPAILGRCECLRESEDRAVLADVARGYRRIAAMPREDDPERWRLANVRLLEVLRRAGADPVRIEARLARLRALDPLVR